MEQKKYLTIVYCVDEDEFDRLSQEASSQLGRQVTAVSACDEVSRAERLETLLEINDINY